MPKLFVIMPFGTKAVHHVTGGHLDFDSVYHQLIRPAALVAGLEPLRIDEVAEAGMISDQYLREIFAADMVLADISLPNGNVYYELGIRHAISTGPTILIAADRTPIPFDLASLRIISYSSDQSKWESTIKQISQSLSFHLTQPFENPIRRFLERIAVAVDPIQDPTAFERDFASRIERSRNVDQLIAVWQWARSLSPIPVAPLLTLADRLADFEEWTTATDLLRSAVKLQPRDFEVHRKLGWCLQFLGPEADEESEQAFKRALDLNPRDPETLGMMGGRAKRLGKLAEAEQFYAQGARVSPNSLYMLVNQAALAILSNPAEPDRGIELYKKLADRIEQKQAASADEWTELVWGEALFALGKEQKAAQHYAAATTQATSLKNVISAARQLEVFAAAGFQSQSAFRLANLLRQRTTEAQTYAQEVGLASSEEDDHAANLPVLIHLSDLHFGSLQKNGKELDMHRFYEGENSQPLSKHIAEEFRKSNSHFSYSSHRLHLIVSGDLTYTGTEPEYEKALQSLNEICESLSIDKRRVHVVPGNHDINWQLAAHNKAYRFDHYLVFLEKFYGEQLFRSKFPRIVWPLTLKNRPAAHDILTVDYDRNAGLLIAGLNSCIYETEQHHYGFVGETQLKMMRELITDLKLSERVTRIAVLHHHLHPFPELLKEREGNEVWLDLSTIRDAGFVERSLERLGFDLVLHGHKHKPQLRESLVQEADPSKRREFRLIVCGAGSASCTELEPNVGNHYEIIELLRRSRAIGADFVRIQWRVLPVEPGAEWTTLRSWNIPG